MRSLTNLNKIYVFLIFLFLIFTIFLALKHKILKFSEQDFENYIGAVLGNKTILRSKTFQTTQTGFSMTSIDIIKKPNPSEFSLQKNSKLFFMQNLDIKTNFLFKFFPSIAPKKIEIKKLKPYSEINFVILEDFKFASLISISSLKIEDSAFILDIGNSKISIENLSLFAQKKKAGKIADMNLAFSVDAKNDFLQKSSILSKFLDINSTQVLNFEINAKIDIFKKNVFVENLTISDEKNNLQISLKNNISFDLEHKTLLFENVKFFLNKKFARENLLFLNGFYDFKNNSYDFKLKNSKEKIELSSLNIFFGKKLDSNLSGKINFYAENSKNNNKKNTKLTIDFEDCAGEIFENSSVKNLNGKIIYDKDALKIENMKFVDGKNTKKTFLNCFVSTDKKQKNYFNALIPNLNLTSFPDKNENTKNFSLYVFGLIFANFTTETTFLRNETNIEINELTYENLKYKNLNLNFELKNAKLNAKSTGNFENGKLDVNLSSDLTNFFRSKNPNDFSLDINFFFQNSEFENMNLFLQKNLDYKFILSGKTNGNAKLEIKNKKMQKLETNLVLSDGNLQFNNEIDDFIKTFKKSEKIKFKTFELKTIFKNEILNLNNVKLLGESFFIKASGNLNFRKKFIDVALNFSDGDSPNILTIFGDFKNPRYQISLTNLLNKLFKS